MKSPSLGRRPVVLFVHRVLGWVAMTCAVMQSRPLAPTGVKIAAGLTALNPDFSEALACRKGAGQEAHGADRTRTG